MDSLAMIRRLHQHRVWSNGRLRAAAEELADVQLRQRFDMGRGSLWSTLAHLYGAEYAWLEALRGRADVPPPGDDAFSRIEELQIAWTALDRRWQRYLDELRPADLEAPIRKISTAYGKPRVFETPASDVLMHVALHAHYTTAQAVNMLRHLGAAAGSLPDLPDTQLITLSRQDTEKRF